MLSLDLKKGMSLNLQKEDDHLNVLAVAMGWQTTKDLDAFCYLIDNYDRIREIVYYGDKNHQGIFLDGDDLVGGGSGDNETITVTLSELSFDITKLIFCANIYNARPARRCGFFKERYVEGDNFGQIKNTFVRCYNKETNEEICRYNLTEDGKGYNAFQFVTMTKGENGWEVHADGIGMNGSIAELKNQIKF